MLTISDSLPQCLEILLALAPPFSVTQGNPETTLSHLGFCPLCHLSTVHAGMFLTGPDSLKFQFCHLGLYYFLVADFWRLPLPAVYPPIYPLQYTSAPLQPCKKWSLFSICRIPAIICLHLRLNLQLFRMIGSYLAKFRGPNEMRIPTLLPSCLPPYNAILFWLL